MLKISEVYEKQIRTIIENPDGSEVATFEKAFATRDCLLNRNYIVSVHPHEFNSSGDLKRVSAAFPEDTKFSTNQNPLRGLDDIYLLYLLGARP